MKERSVVKNDLSEVAHFQRRFEAKLKERGYSEQLIHDLSLVCEEVLVNIVHYGYQGYQPGEAEIQISLSFDEARKITVEVRDEAVAFDPLAAEERDHNDDRLGGWGLPILKAFTDRVEYVRELSENVLTFERSERDS